MNPSHLLKHSIYVWTLLAALWMLPRNGSAQCANCTPVSITSPTASVPLKIAKTADTTRPASGGDAEFNITIYNSATVTLPANLPAGRYQGWCASQSADTAGPNTYVATTAVPASISIAVGLDKNNKIMGGPSRLSNPAVWNQINYILNHKGSASIADVQAAIWGVLGTVVPNADVPTTQMVLSAMQPGALPLFNAAQTTAATTFQPGVGQTMMVLLISPTLGLQHLIIEVPVCGFIGDRVWQDVTVNGLQDTTVVNSPTDLTSVFGYTETAAGAYGLQYSEPGINNVTVQLLDFTGAPIATTRTAKSPGSYAYLPPGTDGWYEFPNLCDGAYTVKIDPTQDANLTALAGMAPTTIQVGGGVNVGIDSRDPAGATVTLPKASGVRVEPTIDFGYKGVPAVDAACPADSGQLEVFYQSALSATGGIPPYTFSIKDGALPGGLALSGATLSGMPQAAGPFTFTMQAVDSTNMAAATVAKSCSITILPKPLSMACANSSGVVGTAYSSQLLADGGVAPYVFSIVGGALPSELHLNASTGAITGTPASAATYTYSAQAVDSSGLKAGTQTTSCGLNILPAVSATCVTVNAVQGVAVVPVKITATGGTGTGYRFSATGLPTGIVMDADGTIHGTPTAAGDYSYSVTVTDSNGNTGTITCSVCVKPAVTAACASITAVQGFALTPVALTGSGGDGGPYIFSATGLPAGLTMDPDGTIHGTPTVSGTFPYTITVKDKDGNSGTTTCTVTVNPPPTAACVSLSAVQGNAIAPVKLTASGGNGGPYTFSDTGLPAGLAMDSDGTISGTPTVSGTFNYTVTIKDRNGNAGVVNCSLTVTPAPTLTLSCPTGAATLGLPYSSAAVMDGGVASYNFSITSGSLPSGLTLNSETGAVTGKPSSAKTFSFTLKGTDATGNSATSTCSIAVAPAPPPSIDLQCGSCGSGKGTVGAGYSATLSVIGGAGPLTYSIDSGTLPPGLTLNPSTGAITGTPAAAGSFTFTSKVVDSRGSSDTATCTIIVVTAPLNLLCGSCGIGQTTVGSAYSAILTVTGGQGPYAYSLSSGSLPPGLTLNASTGAITGVPSAGGTYSFTSRVRDANGNTDTATCTIKVVASPVNLNCGSCGSNQANVGVFHSSALLVTGARGPYSFSIISGSLPPGLTLNGAAGVVSGTPTTAGAYTFTSKVVDANGNSDTATCTIMVSYTQVNLDCGVCGTTSGKVGRAFTASLAVSGGKSPYSYAITSGSLPPGLTLNAATGVISGTPTTPGTYTFTSKVRDANGNTDTATCTVLIAGSALNLDCGSCSSAKTTTGSPYSSTLTVTGGRAPFTFSLASGALPPGLTLNASTGVISGTPTGTGTYSFTTRVKDANGNSDTDTCTLVVVASPVDLQCGSCGSSSAGVGAPYFSSLTARGTSGAVMFSIFAGSLPPGLTLNASTGAISGTPTSAGTYTFTSRVVDSRGYSDTATCAITVAASPVDIQCGACSAGKATVGAPFSSSLSVTGGAAPYTYSISSGSLPAGLMLNASTGVISGTPSVAGAYTFTSRVVDGKGKSDTVTCTLTVVAPPVTLNCGPCSGSKATAGAGYTAQMTVTGGIGPFTYSVSSGSLPAGLTLNAATGMITGTPTTPGIYTLTAKVVDSKGSTDTDICTIVVTAPAVNLECGTCGASKATVNVSYSVTLQPKGGKSPYTYSILSGSLPTGLTLSGTTGTISGKPATAGTYTFTAKVVDANGNSDTATCTIVVAGSVSTGMYTTYTQSEWGASPRGNNAGAVLQANFGSVYPPGSVSIGGSNKLTFTSAAKIAAFLPQGGTPNKLTSSTTNPSGSAAGTLAGQVLALQLSVDFSNRGVLPNGLANLTVKSGALGGYTVTQVLAMANAVLGGNLSALPNGVSLCDLNGGLDSINNNFDGGTSNDGYLK